MKVLITNPTVLIMLLKLDTTGAVRKRPVSINVCIYISELVTILKFYIAFGTQKIKNKIYRKLNA